MPAVPVGGLDPLKRCAYTEFSKVKVAGFKGENVAHIKVDFNRSTVYARNDIE